MYIYFMYVRYNVYTDSLMYTYRYIYIYICPICLYTCDECTILFTNGQKTHCARQANADVDKLPSWSSKMQRSARPSRPVRTPTARLTYISSAPKTEKCNNKTCPT